MQTLPIFVALQNKSVLVVGGGDVALRKVQTLLQFGARVEVVAHSICPELRAIDCDDLSLSVGDYQACQLDDKWLVIAATDNESVNDQVHLDALERKLFVNVVDDLARCHFITPAIIDRSPIVIAISSNGEAPVLARLWKEALEKQIPQWTGRLASLAGRYRKQVKAKFTEFKQRRYFWERFFRGDLASYAAAGKWSQLEQKIENSLAGNETIEPQVYQVFYGDGEPDNLTIKALQLMQLADAIVYPNDTPSAILDLCRKDADKINQQHLSEEPQGVVVYLQPSSHCYWRQL